MIVMENWDSTHGMDSFILNIQFSKEKPMKRIIFPLFFCFSFAPWSFVDAQEYTVIEMEIDVNTSAEDLWAAVGDYCDIAEWANLPCEITSGDGGMGTVRSLLDGRIIEILVAQTGLSYGYTQPAVEGQFYNLYHGFMEARPVTANTSKMLYTLVYDTSNLEGEAAKQADIARRRGIFEGALATMKQIAESR